MRFHSLPWKILLLASVVSISSCASRKFNSGAAVKESPGGACEFTENPQFKPADFRRELTKALNEAAQSNEHPDVADRVADFLESGTGVSQNPLQEERLFWGDNCRLTGILQDAATTPMVISSLMKMERYYGGIVVYGKDVFSEGFYRNRAQAIEIEPAEFARKAFKDANEFLDRDMWFEWKDGRYVRHWSGASRRIIETAFPQGGSVALYRGTSEKYSSADSLLATPVGNFSAFGSFASVFTSPDRRAALKFAKSRLVKFPVDRDQLIALVEGNAGNGAAQGVLNSLGFQTKKNRLAYAGIEGMVEGGFRQSFMMRGYVEVALFVTPTGPNADVLKGVVQECDVPQANWSDDPFSAEGKVCNPL